MNYKRPLIIFSLISLEVISIIILAYFIGGFNTVVIIFAKTILAVLLLKNIINKFLPELQNIIFSNNFKRIIKNLKIFIAAVLLMIPGFFSDFIAILIYTPFMKEIINTFIKNRLIPMAVNRFTKYNKQGSTIDLKDFDN